MATFDSKLTVYRCDKPGCGREHEQRGTQGHYWEGTPPGWAMFSLKSRDARDKNVVANFSNVLLCPEHAAPLIEYQKKFWGDIRG